MDKHEMDMRDYPTLHLYKLNLKNNIFIVVLHLKYVHISTQFKIISVGNYKKPVGVDHCFSSAHCVVCSSSIFGP